MKNVKNVLSRDEMKQILGGCNASASCGNTTISCSGSANCYGGDNGSVGCRQTNGQLLIKFCPNQNTTN